MTRRCGFIAHRRCSGSHASNGCCGRGFRYGSRRRSDARRSARLPSYSTKSARRARPSLSGRLFVAPVVLLSAHSYGPKSKSLPDFPFPADFPSTALPPNGKPAKAPLALKHVYTACNGHRASKYVCRRTEAVFTVPFTAPTNYFPTRYLLRLMQTLI